MQGAYLTITIGIQFFILAGYLFYVIFRAYTTGEDRIALMTWTARLVGFLTFWLLVSVLLVLSMIPPAEVFLTIGILVMDFLGLFLLVLDIRRKASEDQANLGSSP
jgi:hypothetical protein